jgi:RND family efflux transporter MFP subunit
MMIMRISFQRILPLAAIVCLILPAIAAKVKADVASDSAASPSASAAVTVQALSGPSETHNLSFSDVGILKTLMVKPGDEVKTGQVLAAEDSDLDELRYDTMKADADSYTSKTQADADDRDIKKHDADNKKKAYENGGANEEEYDQAELAFQGAAILVQYDEEQQQAKYAEAAVQKRKVEKMKLLSPIDGIVRAVNIHEGEVVDPNKPEGAITVVKIRPLWVDVPLAPAVAARLKIGDKLTMSYEDEPDKVLTGSIIFLDPIVDKTVNQQTVRVELPNDENKPAGLMLNVHVPQADSN